VSVRLRIALASIVCLVVACGGGTTASSSLAAQAPAGSATAAQSPSASTGASAAASIASSSKACEVGVTGIKEMLKLVPALTLAVASKDAAKIKDAGDAIEARADQILTDFPADYTQNQLLGSFGDKLKAVQAAKPTTYDATEITTLAGSVASIAAIAKDLRESCGDFS